MGNTKREKVKLLFEDMTFGSTYTFLEAGKNDDELKDIAEKHDLVLPSPDIAIFKGKYAFVDEQNKNKCNLPKQEVVKALKTLNGKAVDIDHLRKNTVGHWLEASLEGNEIISYGLFWKANYDDEYDDFKTKMEGGGIAISFEAWGERVYKDDESYDLTNIHFAGGALLDEETPAFAGAGVIEFANKTKKERVLEFAKVIEDGKTDPDVVCPAGSEMVNDKKDHFPINTQAQARNALARVAQYSSVPKWWNGTLVELVKKVKNTVKAKYPDIEVSTLFEAARLQTYDLPYIFDIVYSVDNPNTKEIGFWRIDLIDFEHNLVNMTDIMDDTKVQVNLTPKVKEIAQEITAVKLITSAEDNTNKRTVGGKPIMTEQEIKTLMEEVASLKAKVTAIETANADKDKTISTLKEELEKAQTALKTKITEFDTTSAKLVAMEAAKAKELEEANKKIVAQRKEELADFAKDMKDEDLLDNNKYEIAKLKKVNAALIKANKEGKKIEVEMTAGSADDTNNIPDTIKLQKKIHASVWKE